jgi:raffinose/stachyose/melibiose transport system substrate-binding protein
MNEDFVSATYDDGLRMLAQGRGVRYPILTSALAELVTDRPSGRSTGSRRTTSSSCPAC